MGKDVWSICSNREIRLGLPFPKLTLTTGVRQGFRNACVALAERHSGATECAPCKGAGMRSMVFRRATFAESPPSQPSPASEGRSQTAKITLFTVFRKNCETRSIFKRGAFSAYRAVISPSSVKAGGVSRRPPQLDVANCYFKWANSLMLPHPGISDRSSAQVPS